MKAKLLKLLWTLLKRFLIYGLAGFGFGYTASSCINPNVAVETDNIIIDSVIEKDSISLTLPTWEQPAVYDNYA